MEIGLWIAQVSLLGIYGAYGAYKTFWTSTFMQKMDWANNRSKTFIRFVGIAEILGGVGVVLPMLISFLPWLTILAAFGLSLVQLMAIVTVHVPRREFKILPFNVFFLAISIFVLIGRWSLIMNGN